MNEAYDKPGRHADAEVELAKLKSNGDAAAYRSATRYATLSNPANALGWLATAPRLR